jgi:hypothetical protein
MILQTGAASIGYRSIHYDLTTWLAAIAAMAAKAELPAAADRLHAQF